METPSMVTKNHELLAVIPVNGIYILGVYKGSLSQYDILLKYRELQADGKWTRIRTPKHIHWAVDLLIKMNENEEDTKRFLEFLLKYWHDKVTPIRSEEDREHLLDVNRLLCEVESEASNYTELSNSGVYGIKFLLLIAKLLMIQEKTNYEGAYMFGRVLEQLKNSKDIFRIVSAARHR